MQVSIIAAAGADELIHVVVAALDLAVHDAGRLEAQDRPTAVTGQTGGRDRAGGVRPGTQRRVSVILWARYGDEGRRGSQSGTGNAVRIAHSTHRQGQ